MLNSSATNAHTYAYVCIRGRNYTLTHARKYRYGTYVHKIMFRFVSFRHDFASSEPSPNFPYFISWTIRVVTGKRSGDQPGKILKISQFNPLSVEIEVPFANFPSFPLMNKVPRKTSYSWLTKSCNSKKNRCLLKVFIEKHDC